MTTVLLSLGFTFGLGLEVCGLAVGLEIMS